MGQPALRLRKPEVAARFLADLLGGEALPLPPLWNCWLVLGADGDGLVLFPDVLGRQTTDPGDAFAAARTGAGAMAETCLPIARIAALAQRAGWPLRGRFLGGRQALEIAVESRAVLVLILNADAGQEQGRDTALRAALHTMD